MLVEFVDWLVYSLIGLDSETVFGQSVNFFVYDSIKIILLLFVMIFFIGFLRTYISQKKVKKWLGTKNKFMGNVFASIFGAITPFCSCSSIPIFFSFLEARIPLGVAFSFLVTSPLVNEYLAVLMLGFFGWKITVLYILSGIFIGIFTGVIFGRLDLDKYIEKDLFSKDRLAGDVVKYDGIYKRIIFGYHEAKSIILKLWIWIFAGVGIGAIIHNMIPQDVIQGIIGGGGIFMVPIVTLLGVPMYGNCAAIIPIAVVLFEKGVPLGTTLAFMMATAALSFPEAILLRRAMKLRLIALFFGVVALMVVVTGYLFNIFQSVI